MTLHLGLADHRLVMQVGDRLLSQEQGRKIWDSTSNKTLVLLAKNATAVIGYSGLSFIDGIPTDQWIAKRMFGELPGKFHTGLPTSMSDRHQLTLVEAVNAIVAGVREDFTKQSAVNRALGLQVLITGFTWKRIKRNRKFRPRPFMIRLSYDKSKDGFVRAWRTPRWWRWGRQMMVQTIGADVQKKALTELEEFFESGRDDLAVESRLLAFIRDVARGNSEVGNDCTVVTIYADKQSVRVSFMRAEDSDAPANSAFTPWVVGGGIVAAPKQLIAMTGAEMDAGGRVIEFFSSPELEYAPLRSMLGQERKLWTP